MMTNCNLFNDEKYINKTFVYTIPSSSKCCCHIFIKKSDKGVFEIQKPEKIDFSNCSNNELGDSYPTHYTYSSLDCLPEDFLNKELNENQLKSLQEWYDFFWEREFWTMPA